MIKGLAHVCFTVSDLAGAEAFYRDTLGFQRAFDFTRDDGTRFGTYLKAGARCFIELFEGDHTEPTQGQSFRHICLEVDDIEAAVAGLRARGVDVTDPAMGGDGSWQAWMADPDGNRIELHQYTDQSKQLPWLDGGT